jgi:hypothetical protein
MELFRISPLSAFKLSGQIYQLPDLRWNGGADYHYNRSPALKIPMLGEWLDYGLVILVLLFTALGLGFLISLISQTDTQAVQFSMFVL